MLNILLKFLPMHAINTLKKKSNKKNIRVRCGVQSAFDFSPKLRKQMSLNWLIAVSTDKLFNSRVTKL
jgi:hypothetical protein